MKKSTLKRLITSINVIKMNNLKLDINLDIIEEIENFDSSNNYEKKEATININNFDNLIIEKYNLSMKEILNQNKDIFEFINVSFYGNNLLSSFISSRIIRDIINKLNIKTTLKSKNREIIIFSKRKIDDDFINEINSIFNFFDKITNKNNYYKLEIFLSSKKKYINQNLISLDPDNINSGATLPSYYIYIFRKEELIKVLFHELIHYLDLDMRDYQDQFKQLYNKINLKASIINPNEAYTELLALLLMNIWQYYKNNFSLDLKDYINKKLTIELGWSYHQIAKILNFFRCYKKYNSLFTDNCEFIQNSNVLDYFILKTYFLQNINLILKEFKLNNLYMTKNISKNILNNTDLQDIEFSNNIDNILSSYPDDDILYDITSLRMTCID
jgi:hypothetical protein